MIYHIKLAKLNGFPQAEVFPQHAKWRPISRWVVQIEELLPIYTYDLVYVEKRHTCNKNMLQLYLLAQVNFLMYCLLLNVFRPYRFVW